MKPITQLTPTRPAWYWGIPIALILPLLHVAIFTARFGLSKFAPMLLDSIIFIPGGAIASAALIYALRNQMANRSNLVAGFIAGVPFAFLFSLVLPLFMSTFIGATLGVAVPLLAGLAAGYFYKPPNSGDSGTVG